MTTFIQCQTTKQFLLEELNRTRLQLNELENNWCSSHKHITVFGTGGKRPGAGSLFVPKHIVVQTLRDYGRSLLLELESYD